MRTQWRPKRMTGECSIAPCSVLPLIFLTLWVSLCGSAHQGKPWRHHSLLNTVLMHQCGHGAMRLCAHVTPRSCPCSCMHAHLGACLGSAPLCFSAKLLCSTCFCVHVSLCLHALGFTISLQLFQAVCRLGYDSGSFQYFSDVDCSDTVFRCLFTSFKLQLLSHSCKTYTNSSWQCVQCCPLPAERSPPA